MKTEEAALEYSKRLKKIRQGTSIGMIKNQDCHIEGFIAGVKYAQEQANEVNQGAEPALPIQNISVSALNPYAIFDLVHDAHNPTHFETLWNKFLAER